MTTARLLLANEITSIERLAEFLESIGEAHHWTPELVFDLNLCAEEAVVNVIVHGYEDNKPHEIEVTVEFDPTAVSITIEDDGIAYNPLDTKGADIYAPAEERTPGGLGVHIVRALMHDLTYTRAGNRNRFTMTKRIDRAAGLAQL